jgi:hypothetical protein
MKYIAALILLAFVLPILAVGFKASQEKLKLKTQEFILK